MFWLIVAVALVLPGAGVWWGTSVVHAAVERRASTGNAAIARAVGAQIARQYADRATNAGNLLLLLANGAKLDTRLMDASRLSSPFCRIDLLDGTGLSRRTLPLATCGPRTVSPPLRATGMSDVQLPPVVAAGQPGTAGLLIPLNDVERAALGDPRLAWLQAQFPVAGLLSPVEVGHHGSYSVVDNHTGLIVAAPIAATVGRHIAAPAARTLLSSGHAGVLQTYAPNLHATILCAYQPIAGTPFGVFVNLPTAEAFADAAHLRNVLLAGFAILLALGFAAAAIVAGLLRRRDRRLRDSVTELHRLASTDPLTGLPNRTQLLASLDHALALVSRASLPGVAAVFIDLDGVKTLNDQRGHATADRMLVAVATAITGALRASDTIARYGGDEFVLVAPGITNSAEAAVLAQRVCQLIAATEISAGDGQPVRITASAGVAVATVDRPATTSDELLAAADAAMYDAKRCGGNGARTRLPTQRDPERPTRSGLSASARD